MSKKVNRRLSKLLLIVSRKVVCFYLSDDLFIEKINRHDSFERHFENDYTISRSSSTLHVENFLSEETKNGNTFIPKVVHLFSQV